MKTLNFTDIISIPSTELNKAELQPFYRCMKEQIAQKIISCLRIASFLQPVQYSYLYLVYSLRKQVINSDAKNLNSQQYSTGCLKVEDTWTHCNYIALKCNFSGEDDNRLINEDLSQEGKQNVKKFLATEGKETYYAQLKLFDEYVIKRVTMIFNFVHQIQSAATPDIQEIIEKRAPNATSNALYQIADTIKWVLNDFTVNFRDRIENYQQFKQIMDRAAKVYVKLGDLCLYYNERVDMFCGIGRDATLEVNIEEQLDSIW